MFFLLAIDLFVFNRHAHKITLREATYWSVALVCIAAAFAVFLALRVSPQASLEFATGYLIELALSVDNVFVFVLIFSYFRVPWEYQHRVLFWGVLGAMFGRGVMIGAGTVLINRFEWIIYLFGAFLVITGIRMGFGPEHAIDPSHNPVLKLARRFVRVTSSYEKQHFFVRQDADGTGIARWAATPLFIVLLMVETTDLIFAVDSVPAIFAVTRDPFIVYSSNVLAILGLRALYFVLADVIHRFHFLKIGLAVVLSFVGLKMLVSHYLHVPIGISLGVVAGVLIASVVLSLLFPRTAESHDPTKGG